MLRLAIRVVTLILGAGMVCALGMADEGRITARLHPWGLFDPGAWKTVRVVTETLNEHGQVVSTSTTDSKTTLVDIDNDGVTLEVQACMEVAGKRFEAEPQIIRQGFHGELIGPNLHVKEPTDGEVTIAGQKIPCKVQQLECVVPNAKTSTTIYYSTVVTPYVLKRESVTADPDGKCLPISNTNVDVTALSVPLNVRGRTKNGMYVKTVHKNGKGVVTTVAAVVPEVPGGVVSSRSDEVDKAGRLVRRSRLELIDYNLDPEKDHSGLFGRKRANRRGKQPPRYEP